MLDSVSSPSHRILLTIRALLPSLNEQEQKVGQYILEHPESVLHLSISDLAQRSAASDATVFRFCKRIGADGYTDFKIRLAQELVAERIATYVYATEEDSLLARAHKVFSGDIKALEDTLAVLDVEALDRAADALLAARRVDVYGSGGGAVAALELQYKLIRLGIRAVAHTDPELQAISATLLTSDDVAVGVSHSGESRDVYAALEVAKNSGAAIIAITNHPTSAIATLADISLCTAAQEALAYGYPLGARVAQVALIDVLYAFMSLKRPEVTERCLQRISSVLSHHHG